MGVLASVAFAGEAGPGRVTTMAEIVAPRRPQGERRKPLELQSVIPIEQTDLVASTHRSQDGYGEVVVWAKVPGGYRRLETFTEEPGMGAYEPITRFNYDARSFLLLSFMMRAARYAAVYTVRAIEADDGVAPKLTPIEIQSPIEWFRRKLAPDESIQDDFTFTPTTGRLEWSFALYKPGDSHAGPTGGAVRGTFDLCQEQRYDDATRRWSSTWRMLVRDGERAPMTAPAPTPWGSILPVCPAVAAGALLPQPAPAPAP